MDCDFENKGCGGGDSRVVYIIMDKGIKSEYTYPYAHEDHVRDFALYVDSITIEFREKLVNIINH